MREQSPFFGRRVWSSRPLFKSPVMRLYASDVSRSPIPAELDDKPLLIRIELGGTPAPKPSRRGDAGFPVRVSQTCAMPSWPISPGEVPPGRTPGDRPSAPLEDNGLFRLVLEVPHLADSIPTDRCRQRLVATQRGMADVVAMAQVLWARLRWRDLRGVRCDRLIP